MDPVCLVYVSIIAVLCCVFVYLWMKFMGNENIKRIGELEVEIAGLRGKVNYSISSLPPNDLDTYLETLMTICVKLNIAAYGSERNPDLYEVIYTKSSVDFLNYLGDNVEAIELKYSNGYVLRWFNLRFKLITLDGTLKKWISKPMYVTQQDDTDLKMLYDALILNNKRLSEKPGKG